MNNNVWEAYIHIPFCARKCNYCDFLSFPAKEEVQEAYVQALKKEFAARAARRENAFLRSVFIGGGTPSILQSGKILEMMKSFFQYYQVEKDAEITIEANPCTLNLQKLEEYRQAGINRISIGCQSTKDEQLKKLGRLHTSEEFFRAVENAKRAGFSNINADLIFGLPGQTKEQWRDTLKEAAGLSLQHISAYSLIIEEGTPFYEQEKFLALPDEDTLADMYEDTASVLREFHMERYEISNYALPGFESLHNSGYWTGVSYSGFGLGASSYEGNMRFKNTELLREYLENAQNPSKIRQQEQKLSRQEEYAEFMILGLRMTKGVSQKKFEERFQKKLFEVYGPVLQKHMSYGGLILEGDRVRIPEKYLFVSNGILTDFI